MSAQMPAAFFESRPNGNWLVCALCDSGITTTHDDITLADLIKIARAHQRSEVCGA